MTILNKIVGNTEPFPKPCPWCGSRSAREEATYKKGYTTKKKSSSSGQSRSNNYL